MHGAPRLLPGLTEFKLKGVAPFGALIGETVQRRFGSAAKPDGGGMLEQ